MLCFLLECMLTPVNTPPECPKEWQELYFVFCCIWAFGSCLFQDQVVMCHLSCECSFIRVVVGFLKLILLKFQFWCQLCVFFGCDVFSWSTIAWNFQSGGWPNSRLSSFQRKEPSLTITLTRTLRNLNRGARKLRSLNSILICLCRYRICFPNITTKSKLCNVIKQYCWHVLLLLLLHTASKNCWSMHVILIDCVTDRLT